MRQAVRVMAGMALALCVLSCPNLAVAQDGSQGRTTLWVTAAPTSTHDDPPHEQLRSTVEGALPTTADEGDPLMPPPMAALAILFVICGNKLQRRRATHSR